MLSLKVSHVWPLCTPFGNTGFVEDYGYLKGLLEELADSERNRHIPEWPHAGGILLDYLVVSEKIRELKQVSSLLEKQVYYLLHECPCVIFESHIDISCIVLVYHSFVVQVEASDVELDELQQCTASLCSRLGTLKCPTANDRYGIVSDVACHAEVKHSCVVIRLCQAEMAKRCADYMKILLFLLVRSFDTYNFYELKVIVCYCRVTLVKIWFLMTVLCHLFLWLNTLLTFQCWRTTVCLS